VSRKDYVEAARIVREADYLSGEARARLAADLVTFFADDNPRFSPSRFRGACQPVAAPWSRRVRSSATTREKRRQSRPGV
jgi:hypothetical protein